MIPFFILITLTILYLILIQGMNPLGLKAAIEKVARDAGVEVPVVAAITGITYFFICFVLINFLSDTNNKDKQLLKSTTIITR
jgi:preprotein translocase subunit SecG